MAARVKAKTRAFGGSERHPGKEDAMGAIPGPLASAGKPADVRRFNAERGRSGARFEQVCRCKPVSTSRRSECHREKENQTCCEAVHGLSAIAKGRTDGWRHPNQMLPATITRGNRQVFSAKSSWTKRLSQ